MLYIGTKFYPIFSGHDSGKSVKITAIWYYVCQQMTTYPTPESVFQAHLGDIPYNKFKTLSTGFDGHLSTIFKTRA